MDLVLLLSTAFLVSCPFDLLQLWPTLLSVTGFWNRLALGLTFLLLLGPAAGRGALVFLLEPFEAGAPVPHFTFPWNSSRVLICFTLIRKAPASLLYYGSSKTPALLANLFPCGVYFFLLPLRAVRSQSLARALSCCCSWGRCWPGSPGLSVLARPGSAGLPPCAPRRS